MRIDFYILADASLGTREQFACRIVEKAYRMGHRVYLFTDSEAHAARIDGLLWTFRDGSFVPHARLAERIEPAPPVLIGNDSGDGAPDADIIINLTTTAPACFQRYERVAEIVDASDDGRRSGRERFRYYREQGIEPQSHPIDANRSAD
ncbi:MAG: DNA polymerase III subunit chi [Chromatiales bacterium]|jgi:DNA polymerase-3 subunit chi|nr:DNA polymerase III subunit chi [Chromatiales bacterium]